MMKDKKGSLYLCATPIGNLEDITFRVLKTLEEVNIIAAEDTRRTRKLLAHFKIKKQLTSYHRFNKESKGSVLVNMLLEGKDIALVSDAGMPGISDPAYELVKEAVYNDINVVPVPGACALTAALAASGLKTDAFYFQGFLPRKKKERIKTLEELAELKVTLVLYEAPHRLADTLQDMNQIMGNRRAAAARELTKIYEEFKRGTLTELAQHFTSARTKGEITLIVEGASHEEKEEEVTLEAAACEVLENVSKGAFKKEEIKRLAGKYSITKNELYKAVLEQEGRR